MDFAATPWGRVSQILVQWQDIGLTNIQCQEFINSSVSKK
ncbi:hypothetical protein RintRC_6232 [Richelia intracellularis]|nr:hypothetical protein RintRC_6232 [Richelia intracellularis]